MFLENEKAFSLSMKQDNTLQMLIFFSMSFLLLGGSFMTTLTVSKEVPPEVSSVNVVSLMFYKSV